MELDQYKDRNRLLQDTVLLLRTFITDGILVNPSSDIASETTLLDIKDILTDLLSYFEVTETPTKSTVTSSGSIASGYRSVTLITSSDFVGTILSDTATADTVYSMSASPNNTLSSIAYTITSGSMEILKII